MRASELVLTQLSFKNINGSWIGKISGINFIINQENPTEEGMLITTSCAINGEKGELFAYLDRCKRDSIITDYSINKNLLTINYLDEQPKSNIRSFLTELSNILALSDCEGVCLSCGATGRTEAYKVSNAPTLLCSHCVSTINVQINDIKHQPNNYIFGMLGSIMGALLGSLAWIAIGYVGFYASIAGFAIAHASFKGYTLLKGKITTVGVLINICSIIIALLFAEYAGIFLAFMKEFPGMSVSDFVSISSVLFTDFGFIKSILPNIGFGFLFAFIGSYGIVKELYGNAKQLKGLALERIY